MANENTSPRDGVNVVDASDNSHMHTPPRDSKGWDGKLRVEKKTVLENPEAISDPEYSDDEHVLPGEEISADEGRTTHDAGHGGVR